MPVFAAETLIKKKTKKTDTTDDRGLAVVKKNLDGRKRVALVIGNGSYRHTDILPKLANPANDADDMASALRRFGFEVIARKNLTKEEMDEAITDFGRKIADSDAALFYYAGHGLQVKGQNYMVPVDANIDSEAKVPYRAVNINQLLEEMDSSKSRVNIVMLDACRNNPISGKFRSGASRGLAPPSTMPKGTVVVYATDPGNVAADGGGRNGVFTSGLLSAFRGNDLTLGGVLYAASKQVQDATGQQQTPYINGPATVQREFSFVSPSEMTDLRPSEVKIHPIGPVASLQSGGVGLDDDFYSKCIEEFKQYIAEGKLTISSFKGKVTLTIHERELFGSGSVDITNGQQMLSKMGQHIRTLDSSKVSIFISDYTDYIPVGLTGYKSIPALSTARAKNVAKFFANIGLNGDNITTNGFGDSHPRVEIELTVR